MAKEREEELDISSVKVKLKPILGIRPGVYLTWLYGILVATLLFFLLFFPGIRKNGTLLSISTSPQGAAVFVDDLYAGSTPLRTFVQKGTRHLFISRPNFISIDEPIPVKGRLFGSLFLKRKLTIEKRLQLDDYHALLQTAFIELSRLALVDRFGASYQPPRVISETIAALFAGNLRDSNEVSDLKNLVDVFLTQSLKNMSSNVLLGDLIRGVFLAESEGNVPNAGTIMGVLHKIIQLNVEYQNLSIPLPALLQEEYAQRIVEEPWYLRSYDLVRLALSSSDPPLPGFGAVQQFAGQTYAFLQAGEFLLGKTEVPGATFELPHLVAVQDLFVGTREVSRGSYQSFVAENPEWRIGNRNVLSQKGLVTDRYLYNWQDPIAGDSAISYVSQNAALAYCEWFTLQLPQRFIDEGYTARLPSEREWEWIAKNASQAAESPIAQIQGGVWEWTDTWFFPAEYFVSSLKEVLPEPDFLFEGAEMVVRGGSSANVDEYAVNITTRGSQPPDWCTEFLGFRVVISRQR